MPRAVATMKRLDSLKGETRCDEGGHEKSRLHATGRHQQHADLFACSGFRNPVQSACCRAESARWREVFGVSASTLRGRNVLSVIRQLVMLAAGIIASVLLSWVLFRNTDWSHITDALGHARPGYVVGCVVFFCGTFFARAYRLRAIIEIEGPVRYRPVFNVLAISWLTRTVFPPVPLSVFQAAALFRLLPRPFSHLLGATTADMLIEGLSVSLMLLAVLIFIPTGSDFSVPEDLFAAPGALTVPARLFEQGVSGVWIFVIAQILVVLLIYRFRRAIANGARRWSRRFGDGLEAFVDHLHIFGNRRQLIHMLTANLLHWFCYTACMVCLLEAFDVAWPWYGPFLLVALMGIALTQPGAPGFVGQVHFAMVAGVILMAPQHPVDEVKALAILIHLVYVGSVVVIGLICLLVEQTYLRNPQIQPDPVTD